jgi:G:T-mismatch repair DNA endonuclease (very short patch repair protein)
VVSSFALGFGSFIVWNSAMRRKVAVREEMIRIWEMAEK